MDFYILFGILIVPVALLGQKKDWVGTFVLVLMLFLSLFRGDDVGNDTKNYMDDRRIYVISTSYEMNLSGDYIVDNFGHSTEYLSHALNMLVFYNNLSPRIIIYVYSLVTFVFLYLAFRRFKINLALGAMIYVLLGLYYFSFTAARQMAAVSLFLYGASFILESSKKRYLFFIITLICAFIHSSAFFFIWVYFIRSLKIDRKVTLYIAGAIAIVTLLLPINLMDFIYSNMGIDYITRYQGNYDESHRSFLGRIFDFISTLCLLYFYHNKKENKTDFRDLLFSLAIILTALFSSYSILISRITFYATIFICIFMANEIVDNKKIVDSPVLWLWIALLIYDLKGWAVSLASDYYLMFNI